jgi:signal transduction histidine kinase
VPVDRDGELAVAVESGAGTSRNGSTNGQPAGVGIAGMTERAEAVGGTLRTAPLASGFRVEATLPYARLRP